MKLTSKSASSSLLRKSRFSGFRSENKKAQHVRAQGSSTSKPFLLSRTPMNDALAVKISDGGSDDVHNVAGVGLVVGWK